MSTAHATQATFCTYISHSNGSFFMAEYSCFSVSVGKLLPSFKSARLSMNSFSVIFLPMFCNGLKDYMQWLFFKTGHYIFGFQVPILLINSVIYNNSNNDCILCVLSRLVILYILNLTHKKYINCCLRSSNI